VKISIAGQEYDVQPDAASATVGGKEFTIRTVRSANIVTVYVNEKPIAVQLPADIPEEGPLRLLVDAKEYEVEVKGRGTAVRKKPKVAAKKTVAAGGAGAVLSQMTGRVIRVDVSPGDAVSEGDILLIIEAMKMENEIVAPVSGVVKQVAVAAGARVSEGDLLAEIEPASGGE
jgi:biotin carboxyl carrier protein